MMTHVYDVGRAVYLTVDHALGIRRQIGRAYRNRIEVVFDEIVGLDKFWRTRTETGSSDPTLPGCAPDMSECVHNALVGHDDTPAPTILDLAN